MGKASRAKHRREVSPSIYRNTSRAERQRIADELIEIKALDASHDPLRAAFKERCADIQADLVPDPVKLERLVRDFGPVEKLLAPATVPIRLLACPSCFKPTSRCECLDTYGKPLFEAWNRRPVALS
jgi:hypothetical protein